MRIFGSLFVVSDIIAVAACAGGRSESPTQSFVSEPTPDVAATVESSVHGTQEAEAAIDATVQARVASILTATQLTATPWPTATLYGTGRSRSPEPTWKPCSAPRCVADARY